MDWNIKYNSQLIWGQTLLGLEFNEEYFKTEGYNNYKDYPHFRKRADFIRDVIKPLKGVIIFGGAIGHVNKYLTFFGMNNINWETSEYCFENKDLVCAMEPDDTKIDFDKYDWIISWNVLDCQNENNINETLVKLNAFKGKQIHIICCDEHESSENFKEQGYFIKTHDYWQTALPNACLICYDCKKVIQLPTGYSKITKVPLCWGDVTE